PFACCWSVWCSWRTVVWPSLGSWKPPQFVVLLRVWLIASLRAIADPPDVAVGVCERTAVPAPLQLRRGLEDLGAGLLCFVHHLIDSLLAADDVVQGQAGEAAALRVHANVRREALAPVEPHERTPVWDGAH